MRKPSKPPTTIIDREKMPFSEAELYSAFHLVLPIQTSKEVARSIAEGIRDERWSEASAAAAIARGSRNTAEINSSTLFYPAVLPLLLALVSPQLHSRVENWRTANRERMHRSLMMNATFSLTRKRPIEPWPEEAVRQVQEEYKQEDAHWAEALKVVRKEVVSLRRVLNNREPDAVARVNALLASVTT